MNKDIKKKFDEEFPIFLTDKQQLEIKAFIDEHLIAKEEVEHLSSTIQSLKKHGGRVYTKEQVLELIGEDTKNYLEDVNYGYNLAKQIIRERL